MKKGILIITLLLLITVLYFTNRKSKDEKLAKQYCGTCHQFPDPSLLDKKHWVESVIPRMAYRMGIKVNITFDLRDLKLIESLVPDKPMISEADLELIKQYYLRKAPEKIISEQKPISDHQQQFQPEPINHFAKHRLTLLKFDSLNQRLYLGDVHSWLYQISGNFDVIDSMELESPPTFLLSNDTSISISLLGEILPSDKPDGKLVSISKDHVERLIIDSLKRPVFFAYEDLNGDGINDLVTCSFGNYSGSLSMYKNGNTKQKINISTSAGARKIEIIDWDKDGKKDIIALIAQGDERLIFYKNLGNYNFQYKELFRFPPIYGSCFFELVDFNQDGLMDIVYSNGDNADYTKIIKPYHGIKIFIQNERQGIREDWSYSLPGAYQTKTFDFDGDGDLDIAAISAFPDLEKHPEQSFLYLENTGSHQFKPQIEPATTNGKWMTMETYDADNDGDLDIVLGAFTLDDLRSTKNKRMPGTLFLRNKQK